MCFIVPAIFIAVAIIPLLFYKLDDKEVMEMDGEIALRKKPPLKGRIRRPGSSRISLHRKVHIAERKNLFFGALLLINKIRMRNR